MSPLKVVTRFSARLALKKERLSTLAEEESSPSATRKGVESSASFISRGLRLRKQSSQLTS